MLTVPTLAFVLVWLAVLLAVGAAFAGIAGRALLGPRDRGVLADATLPCFAFGAVVVSAAFLTGVWPAAVVGVGTILVAMIGARQLVRPARHILQPSAWLVSSAIAAALLAIVIALFWLQGIYGDAPTTVHLCSG
jgi:energy-converting hydrogenase Eha subunit A